MAFARSNYRANYRQQTNYNGTSYHNNRAGDHTQLHRRGQTSNEERTWHGRRDDARNHGPSEDGYRWRRRPQDVARTTARDGYNSSGRFPCNDGLSRHSRPRDIWRPVNREHHGANAERPGDARRPLARDEQQNDKLSWRGRPGDVGRNGGFKGHRGPDRDELSCLPHQPREVRRHSARNGLHEGGRHRETGELSWRRRPGDEERTSSRAPEPAPLVHAMPWSPPRAVNAQGSRSECRQDPGGHARPVSLTQIPASGPVVQEHRVDNESPPTPPPPVSNGGQTEEQVERKSCAIIEEYLETHDMTEATQCVEELGSVALLNVFVRSAMDTTLEHTSSAREQVGRLLQQLVKAGTLPSEQYLKGLREILDAAEDTAIDVPLIWLYLAELIAPMICDGGIMMGQLFREISTPLVSLGRAGVLLAHILQLLVNEMTRQVVGDLWTESGLRWEDFLSEGADVEVFVREQNLEFTAGEPQLKECRAEGSRVQELSQHLSQLLQGDADQHQILDWLESNVEEEVAASHQFVATLMASLSQVAMEDDFAPGCLRDRAALLQRFLVEEDKQLQALYALQALMEERHHPKNLLRSIFDALYDADVVSYEVLCRWEVSDDPEQQEGKASALESVELFFKWLHCDEEDL